MIGICIKPLPVDDPIDAVEGARVVLFSREFRDLKKRRADEEEFAVWRTSVRERFGSQARRLLEIVSEHVYIMENFMGGDNDGQYQYQAESGNTVGRLPQISGEQAKNT